MRSPPTGESSVAEILTKEPEEHAVDPGAVPPVRLAPHSLADKARSLRMADRPLVEAVDLEPRAGGSRGRRSDVAGKASRRVCEIASPGVRVDCQPAEARDATTRRSAARRRSVPARAPPASITNTPKASGSCSGALDLGPDRVGVGGADGGEKRLDLLVREEPGEEVDVAAFARRRRTPEPDQHRVLHVRAPAASRRSRRPAHAGAERDSGEDQREAGEIDGRDVLAENDRAVRERHRRHEVRDEDRPRRLAAAIPKRRATRSPCRRLRGRRPRQAPSSRAAPRQLGEPERDRDERRDPASSTTAITSRLRPPMRALAEEAGRRVAEPGAHDRERPDHARASPAGRTHRRAADADEADHDTDQPQPPRALVPDEPVGEDGGEDRGGRLERARQAPSRSASRPRRSARRGARR